MRHGQAAENHDSQSPGEYLTDGVSLFRLLDPLRAHPGWIAIEDCGSLEVLIVHTDELRASELTPVAQRAMAMAA